MKKIIFAFLFQLSIICVVNAQPGIGFSTYVGTINAYRIPNTNKFFMIPLTLQFYRFSLYSFKAVGYNGSRRLRGYGYLGNNTDDLESSATQKFMQIRLIDSWIPNKNTLRVGWRYTNRQGSIPEQYELGIYSHINHRGGDSIKNGREAHTFGLATYRKFRIFEYSLIISRRHGFATRIQYQGIDSTAWIVRTIQDWKANGFTLTDAEASIYAERKNSLPPNPTYINAFSSSVITPSFNEPKFWHVNVGMMNTWVKSAEVKEITAQNYINLLLETTVINYNNNSHPPNARKPYLKVESGGMLIVESKGTINTDISKSNFTHNLIDVSYGSNVRFVIVP
jgi:hypothetical protein